MTPKITFDNSQKIKAIVFSENVKISNMELFKIKKSGFFKMKIAQYRNYQKERSGLNELPF